MIRSWKLILSLCFLSILGLSAQATTLNGCVYIHLDKNYLFQGDTLRGSLHVAECAGRLLQVMVALTDEQDNVVFNHRLKVENGPIPFQSNIPENTTPGVYQLVVFEPNTGQLLFGQTLTVFDPRELLIRDLVKKENLSPKLRQNSARGIDVHIQKPTADRRLTLKLQLDQSLQFPVNLSVKLSDQAQSVPGTIPGVAGSAAGDYRQKLQGKPRANATFTLNGTLTTEAGQSCAYCPLILSIPEQSAGIFYTRTDEAGRFSFSGLTHQGDKRGYLWYQHDPTNPLELTVLPDHEIPKVPVEKSLEEMKQQLAPVLARRLLANSMALSAEKRVSQESQPVRNYQQVALYPEFDFQILFDEYYLEPDMKTNLKNLVPNVNFIRTDQVRVFSYEQRRNYGQSPLILLDGIPIDNQKLLSLDPASVHRVEVLHQTQNLAKIGNIASNGVVSVVTKNGTDYREIPGVKRVYISGFYSYEGDFPVTPASQPLPQIIYWDPSITVNADGTQVKIKLPEFDLRALISIVGTDSNGKTIYFFGEYVD